MKHPIARYLMCAYAYYEEDNPIITDHEFDSLAKWILHNYDDIEHMHKDLVTKNDLVAGTYLGKYPTIVKSSLRHYRLTVLKGRRLAEPMEWNSPTGLEEFM